MVDQNNRYFPDLKPGSTFSHYSHGSPLRQYRIIGMLGKGEIKNTYVAEMVNPEELKGRLYALKVFKHPSELTAKTAIENLENLSGQMERQYLEEINMLDSADKGRYIATMADTGLFSVDNIQLLYLAEELIDGPNLMQYMMLMTEHKATMRGRRNQPKRQALMTEYCDDVVRIITKACRGIHYLHEKVQAAHGDVKPENILIGLKGDKLHSAMTDFTTSRALSDLSYVQAGSMLYRAPEHLSGTVMATTKADVWSLGVVLWEALAGEYPFRTSVPDWSALNKAARAAQEAELNHNILTAEVDPLSKRNPRNINPNSTLDTLVQKMLSKDPEERPDMYYVYLNLQKVRRSIKEEKGFNPDIPGNFLKTILTNWRNEYSSRFII